jgi:ABC-type phosphate transport system substrate-binding protein
MNFKKILKTFAAGLSVFAMVGTASAAITSDINLYGASAQFNVWTANAGPYMASQGCTNIQSATRDSKNAIVKGTCSGVDRYFRISSKASYDGPLAIQGNTTNPFRVNECASPYERLMVNEATCTWGGTCSGTKCVPVTVGASDVPVGCFTQESHGALAGPLGGVWTDRNFKTNPITWTGAEPCKPLVVPFAFFANNTVSKLGSTISNITKDNAEIIFNGQAYNWSDLVDVDGTSFDADPIAVCLRHAGSGTHASIDAYLNSPLINTQEVAAGDHFFYFNDGSSDLMKCVNGSGSWSGAGAIGYADADQSLTSYPNSVILDLNGITPNATDLPNAIAEGAYNFYGLQQLYGITASDPLCVYAGNPANITNPVWVAKCKLTYNRVNGCESFPVQWVGASCP